ncbi:hypothetical protein BZK31_16085 [Pseudomonas floridensis]|uniref:Uncharacterized protein n=1 Tax=Pseudomonas floridensis TaxID=1958950 RepID=A0A1X0N5U5_9PSED|nr:hypothetical protein [Pseudomonas floridensis]ORC58233.1 hypothetical protein BZK31_16085 [Pseudomonas floridensis]
MTSHTGNASYLGNRPSLVAFLPGLSRQAREDVQDVLLDAQLFADRLNDFDEQWANWMHYYRHRLGMRGLQQEGLVVGDSRVLSSTEDLFEATFKVTGSASRERLGGMVQRAFSALGIEQAAEAYFQHGVDQGRLGSFQIVPCERLDDKRVSMLLCSLRLSVDEHSGGARRLLFFFKGGSYAFDTQAYAAHRDDVKRYLGGKARNLIRETSI